MEISNVYINNKLTPMTLIEIGKHLCIFRPIYENKICNSLIMNYTKSAVCPSTDIPAQVQEIYSTTTDTVTISSLFEINNANSIFINSHAKKIKSKDNIHYDRNKLCNTNNKKIVKHFIIHDITNTKKRIFNLYTKLFDKLN